MKAIQTLPEQYKEIFSVDLQRDKKVAILVNVLSLIIAVFMIVPMHFYISIETLFDMSEGLVAYTMRFFILMILIVIYMVFHELVHGVTMKFYGTRKVKYGFNGMYAFAGSDDYYDKKSYILIALAPVILWGVVLAVLNAFVSVEWFWVVYMIQVCNVSGAAGDMYVTAKFSRFPQDILVRDSGIGMVVYSKKEI